MVRVDMVWKLTKLLVKIHCWRDFMKLLCSYEVLMQNVVQETFGAKFK